MIRPSFTKPEIDESIQRMETFYQPEDMALKSYQQDRLHAAHLYTYHCTNEELAQMLSDCNVKLKEIDDDLLKYLSDSAELFKEYQSKIKIIGKHNLDFP